MTSLSAHSSLLLSGDILDSLRELWWHPRFFKTWGILQEGGTFVANHTHLCEYKNVFIKYYISQQGIERSAFQNNSNMLVLKLALHNSARSTKVCGWSGRRVLTCRCPSPPGVQDQVPPLKATAGTQNSSLPLSFSSFLLCHRGFTISSRRLRSQLDPLLSDSNNNKSVSHY